MSRYRISLASLILFAAATLAPSQVGIPSTPPDVVINEVCFDPFGATGSEGSCQWLELYFKTAANPQGWKIKNANGQLLMTLPSVNMPADSYLVAYFGPHQPDFENADPSSGAVVIGSGQPLADYLGVHQGGLKLRANGTTLDKIFWGTGSGQSPFFDLSFASGQPIGEGDTIGRDQHGTDTNSPADFSIGGGANSNGPTAGAQNLVEFPEANGLLIYAENTVNLILAGLSSSDTQGGWLKVMGTNPSPGAVTPSPTNPDMITFTSQHSFMALINGMPVALVGSLQSSYTRDTSSHATGETHVVAGTLASPGNQYALDINVSRISSGGHGSPDVVTYATSYTWHQNGTAYPVNLTGTTTTTQIADGVSRYNDVRSGTQFGWTGTKQCAIEATFTKTGDGSFNVSSVLTRDYPSLLPYPGNTQSAGSEEQVYEEMDVVTDGLFNITNATVTRLDQIVDGFLRMQLQPGQTGAISSSLSQTANGSAFSGAAVYPVDILGTYVDISASADLDVTVANGKELTTGSYEAAIGSQVWASAGFAIDPPVAPSEEGEEKRSVGSRVCHFVGYSLACGVAGHIAKVKAAGGAFRRSLIKTLGKAIAKKCIPVIGQLSTAVCVCKAIQDQF